LHRSPRAFCEHEDARAQWHDEFHLVFDDHEGHSRTARILPKDLERFLVVPFGVVGIG
jgi:hypothetical protein